MIRLDSSVSVMIASEEDADTIEKALKDGVVVLTTSDDIGSGLGLGFEVLLLDGSEEHTDKAKQILG